MIRFDNEADSHGLHPNEGSSTLSGAGHPARGLLSWTQANLAKAASVGTVTVSQFEGESGTPQPAMLTVLQQALEAAGLAFIPETGGGAGIRFRNRKG
ncbi:helix-turn-helix domain-containing protein [Methylobacterium sp. J-088]|uniref:helix-turn-helix domain-containing protein n=1 Tax=unclassified Methylobacterium TaxID=2615210 RepID=UPI001FB9306E|nr:MULTISPECIES: helix-turn-helix domain-containing protein [unclassified Methylobacterium]MCJ2062306.1 helix-turn-helix domain-containing protein [Methylobacterium sp. J-088]